MLFCVDADESEPQSSAARFVKAPLRCASDSSSQCSPRPRIWTPLSSDSASAKAPLLKPGARERKDGSQADERFDTQEVVCLASQEDSQAKGGSWQAESPAKTPEDPPLLSNETVAVPTQWRTPPDRSPKKPPPPPEMELEMEMEIGVEAEVEVEAEAEAEAKTKAEVRARPEVKMLNQVLGKEPPAVYQGKVCAAPPAFADAGMCPRCGAVLHDSLTPCDCEAESRGQPRKPEVPGVTKPPRLLRKLEVLEQFRARGELAKPPYDRMEEKLEASALGDDGGEEEETLTAPNSPERPEPKSTPPCVQPSAKSGSRSSSATRKMLPRKSPDRLKSNRDVAWRMKPTKDLDRLASVLSRRSPVRDTPRSRPFFDKAASVLLLDGSTRRLADPSLLDGSSGPAEPVAHVRLVPAKTSSTSSTNQQEARSSAPATASKVCSASKAVGGGGGKGNEKPTLSTSSSSSSSASSSSSSSASGIVSTGEPAARGGAPIAGAPIDGAARDAAARDAAAKDAASVAKENKHSNRGAAAVTRDPFSEQLTETKDATQTSQQDVRRSGRKRKPSTRASEAGMTLFAMESPARPRPKPSRPCATPLLLERPDTAPASSRTRKRTRRQARDVLRTADDARFSGELFLTSRGSPMEKPASQPRRSQSGTQYPALPNLSPEVKERKVRRMASPSQRDDVVAAFHHERRKRADAERALKEVRVVELAPVSLTAENRLREHARNEKKRRLDLQNRLALVEEQLKRTVTEGTSQREGALQSRPSPVKTLGSVECLQVADPRTTICFQRPLNEPLRSRAALQIELRNYSSECLVYKVKTNWIDAVGAHPTYGHVKEGQSQIICLTIKNEDKARERAAAKGMSRADFQIKTAPLCEEAVALEWTSARHKQFWQKLDKHDIGGLHFAVDVEL
eukprot:scaffold736_cov254-Pinguiococcus_pyrenoidosus.AAC.25